MSGENNEITNNPQTPGWDSRFYERSCLFWPIAQVASRFVSFTTWPEVSAYDELLAPLAGVFFRLQPPKPRRRRRREPIDPSTLYDARIAAEGWVPTRFGSWHDFLNALVWATFPESKRVFHERQQKAVAARIEASTKVLPNTRTREQDGLAILDEGSLLLLVETSQWETIKAAHEARDIHPVADAIQQGKAVALAFGHALYESLLLPREKAIWAMVVLLPCPGPIPTDAETRIKMADQLLAERINTPNSFADPTEFRSLPLEKRLCAPQKA